MELNKYDLVELLAYRLKGLPYEECPIKQECDESNKQICLHEDEARELLIKKYNL